MKHIYSLFLFQCVKILGMIGNDVASLRSKTSGSLRLLLSQLLRDLSFIHNLVRIEAIRVTSELLEQSQSALEQSNHKLKLAERKLAERKLAEKLSDTPDENP